MKLFRSFTFDALKKPRKKPFKPPTSAEIKFNRQLKKVARASGHLVEAHIDGATIVGNEALQKALADYARAITPWAIRQSSQMLSQVSNANKRAYQNNSQAMGAALRTGVAESDVGRAAAALLNEQVALITSIPIEAGKRAQSLAQEAFFNGSRADEIAKELMRTTEVTESRATLIARTEVARSNSVIAQARAVSVGSRQYIWRNSGDEAVRHSHEWYRGKKLDGMIFNWDHPPTLDDGTTGHPGTFPNCRCYPQAVFDDK